METGAVPSYADVIAAFAGIRETQAWDYEHPQRRFVLAADWAASTVRDCERLAAYRLAGSKPPLGYYDDAIDRLHLAIELLRCERTSDHGDVPYCLPDPRSAVLREAK